MIEVFGKKCPCCGNSITNIKDSKFKLSKLKIGGEASLNPSVKADLEIENKEIDLNESILQLRLRFPNTNWLLCIVCKKIFTETNVDFSNMIDLLTIIKENIFIGLIDLRIEEVVTHLRMQPYIAEQFLTIFKNVSIKELLIEHRTAVVMIGNYQEKNDHFMIIFRYNQKNGFILCKRIDEDGSNLYIVKSVGRCG
jgi:hypothetical protein